MRLLLIANPGAYRTASTDVPLGYERLAAHPDVELFHADTQAMLAPGESIRACRVEAGFRAEEFDGLREGSPQEHSPDDFDVAFCRTLKPFPERYLTRLQERPLRYVNDPAGIERQLGLSFVVEAAAEFMPPTLITREADEAEAFLTEHGVVVAKRANSCGGRGVYKLWRQQGQVVVDHVTDGAKRFRGLAETLDRLGGEELLFSRYLPRVTEGEKRVIALDGMILGAYLRTSTTGHWIQNVSFGASCDLLEVSERNREIVARTCEAYRREGIHLLGYDLLRDDEGKWVVSEINAGNIGGVFRLETMGVEGVTDRVAQWLQAFAAARLPSA